MKVWQAIGCGVVCLVAFIGMIVGVVFYATSGISDTADGFFAAVADGEYEAAQEFTSQRLRETTSPDDLKEFVEIHRIGNVTDTTWSSRSIENSTGELSGTVETQSGAVIPMTILFVSEGDEWRIDGFDINAPGLSGPQSRRPDAEAGGDGSAASGAANPRIDPEALAASNEGGVPKHMWLNDAWIDGDYMMFSTVWKDRPSPASLAARFPSDGLSAAELEQLDSALSDVEIAEFDEEGRLVVGYVRNLPGRAVRTVFTYERVPGATRPWQIVELTVDKGGS